jgi:hypothetical protein
VVIRAARTHAVPCPLERPDTLRQLLVSRGVPAAADDEELLLAARAPGHKLAVTVLSAQAAAGQALRPEQSEELAAHRHRIDRYRQAWSVVSSAAPDACVVKGSSVGARYPAGLLRAAGDMDVVCPAPQLWAAALALLQDGWHVGAFTVFPGQASASTVSGGEEILIELNQPSDTEIEEPYGVELRTVEVGTSILHPGQQPAAPLSPVAGNVLALVAERWERPFRTRDVYDLAVLHEHLDAGERASLAAGLTATGLWPEMRELSALLRRSGLRPAPDLPGSQRSARWARAARLARSAVRWSHPVRVLGVLALTTVDSDHGTLADWVARVVHERIGARRLLNLGLPLFAVPLPSVALPSVALPSVALPSAPDLPPASAGLRLVRLGAHLVAVTPVGRFLMVAGSCPESWLAQAAGELPDAGQ